MKRILFLLLVCSLCVVTFAQQGEEAPEAEEAPAAVRSEEALAILEKVDAAIKAIDSVRYQSSSTPTGIAVNFVKPAQGTVVLSGWTGALPERFYSDLEIQGDEPFRLTGGGDGDTYFIIDHKTKKAYEDMDVGVLGTNGNTLQSLYLTQFVSDTAFDDEMSAETIELLDEEQRDGEDCYKIRIVYPNGREVATWLFAKSDYLPRARIRVFNIPQGEGTLEQTISALEISPALDDSLFKLKLPKGYEQIDDFAP